MSPDASDKNLLYVSQDESVVVYDYLTDTQVGQLQYFTHASGACTDASGNVYVTNNQAADVLEFAHGKSSPIKTLLDTDPYPTDCAVDLATGNLAVINEYGQTQSSPGNVAIFAGGKGKAKTYTVKGISKLVSGSYDATGDLLVGGYDSSSHLAFAILDNKSSAFKSVNLPHSTEWTMPGFIRWDGEYFDVEFEVPYDQFPAVFVWYTIKGTTGTQEGYMLTEGSTENSGPFWLGRIGASKNLKRANQLVASTGSGLDFWNYPEGGAYIFQMYDLQDLAGLTVSLAHK